MVTDLGGFERGLQQFLEEELPINGYWQGQLSEALLAEQNLPI